MHIDGNIESEQETELFLELENQISIYPGELCRPLCMSTAIICLTIGTILCGKKAAECGINTYKYYVLVQLGYFKSK